MNLLYKVPLVLLVPKCLSAWVSKCPLSARPPKCPLSAQAPQVLECQSIQVSWVPECRNILRVPECLSALLSDLRVPWGTFWVPNFPLSTLWIKKACNITRNGLANSFFKNFLEHMGNKMCKLYHVLLARCNHSKGFQKLSLNIL